MLKMLIKFFLGNLLVKDHPYLTAFLIKITLGSRCKVKIGVK